jgi:hypothetical protein
MQYWRGVALICACSMNSLSAAGGGRLFMAGNGHSLGKFERPLQTGSCCSLFSIDRQRPTHCRRIEPIFSFCKAATCTRSCHRYEQKKRKTAPAGAAVLDAYVLR